MFFCVVGTSTSFTYWAFDLASCAMKLVFGDFHRVHCTSAEEMLLEREKRDGKPVLFTTDFLEDGLSDILISSGIPIAVVLDTAETAMAMAALLRKMSFLQCVRHTSLYVASLDVILNHDKSVVFGPEYLDCSFYAFANAFLSAIHIDCDADRLLTMMRGSGLGRFPNEEIAVRQLVQLTRTTVEISDVIEKWTPSEQEAFYSISSTLQKYLDGNAARTFNCPLELLHSESDGYKIYGPIELIGPARLLIWGPYLYLVKTEWTVTMEFEVSESISLNIITADILLGGQIASVGEFDLPTQGIFSWSMSFKVTDFSKSVEVRLLLSRSAIEGKLALRKVNFARQS